MKKNITRKAKTLPPTRRLKKPSGCSTSTISTTLSTLSPLDKVQQNYVDENDLGHQIHFNSLVAIKHDIPTAILFNMMIYWISYNTTNDKNFRDGYYWTYNSATSIRETHVYMSTNIIRNSIKNLLLEGSLIKAKKNYNRHNYDKTSWYRLNEKSIKSIYKISSNELLNPKGIL